jgi:hypothetical protein
MGLNQCAISPESEGENFYARRDLIWPASSDVLLVLSFPHSTDYIGRITDVKPRTLQSSGYTLHLTLTSSLQDEFFFCEQATVCGSVGGRE